MTKAAIEAQQTVELTECGVEGTRETRIKEYDTSSIEWDRFMRLSKVAEQIKQLQLTKDDIILDVGGFDGAFALFLPHLKVWVVDPLTTGGSGLSLPFSDNSFKVVVSIDAIEHMPRSDRPLLLSELVRITKSKLFVNYPEAKSMEAQRQVLSLIPNKFIEDHVKYELPQHDEVVSLLKSILPSLHIRAYPHTNIYTWASWYVLFHSAKEEGVSMSHFLKKSFHDANVPPYLYDLLVCEKES